MAQVNDIIALDLTLWDGDPNKYVRAWVRADGVLLPISPVSMPHIGLGQYFEQGSVLFPVNTTHLSIVYEVFNDAGFVTKSPIHSQASESYEFDSGGSTGLSQELLDKLNQIADLVTAHGTSSQIIGEIVDDFYLDGYVLESDYIGLVYDDSIITGVVVPIPELDAAVNDSDTINGTI